MIDSPLWLPVAFERWWNRQNWIQSPFSWIPFLVIGLLLYPVSLVWYMLKTLFWKEEKDNAK